MPCSIPEAVSILHDGGLIAYPTEAVYGLGCDPCNETAVRQLLELKQRASSKGLILVAARFSQLADWLLPLPEARSQEILASWPGPVTWLLPASPQAPPWLCGEHETLAVRVSAHPAIQALSLAFGGPVVSTSANLAGQDPLRDATRVQIQFGRQLGGILEGKLGGLARPTEIRDGRTGRVIRTGNGENAGDDSSSSP